MPTKIQPRLLFPLLLACLVPSLARAESPPRGYQARACGFDLDDDGIVGEPEDCRICNASVAGGTITGGILDPDGDGVNEDQIYVDCGTGVDQAGCGAPGAPPCRSIAYAFNTIADGPGDGAEDVVCFRGTCSPNDLTPAVAGVPGHRTEPRSGTEQRDWQFPTNPAMLVGWDTDGDGRYPPVDGDDTAVLDGAIGNRARAFHLNDGADNSYFELAHFTVRDYGVSDSGGEGGFLKANQVGTRSHLHLHDLALRNINKDRPLQSNRIVFNLFHIHGMSWMAVTNIEALSSGGFFVRGSASDNPPDTGPFRFQNLSVTAHSCDFGTAACNGGWAAWAGFRMWGYVSGVEILDSVFDANVDAWQPQVSGGPPGALAFNPYSCMRDWTIRNNEMIDFKVALSVEGGDQNFCATNPRTTSDIVFDRNLFRNSYPFWSFGTMMTSITTPGSAPNRHVENVTITSNIFSSTAGQLETCLHYASGSNATAASGTIVFANNTCHGDLQRSGYAAIYLRNQAANKHQNWVIRNNLISGLEPNDLNIKTEFQPGSWNVDSNVYDADGLYAWDGGSQATLPAWRTTSGGDNASRTCTPLYANLSGGDYHLRFDDSCARDAGQGLPGIVALDFDGEPRGYGLGWDIGADEYLPEGSLIFQDSFEAGGLSAWSAVEP